MKKLIYLLAMLSCGIETYGQFSISGNVTDTLLSPISGARITLFNADTSFFAEKRTGTNGTFSFSNISADTYTLGIAKVEKEYKDTLLNLSGNVSGLSFTLYKETQLGQWNVIMTSPEPLGGTDLGVLLPDGNIFYCHDTKDPFLFNPQINDTVGVNGYDTTQGCVGATLLYDGRVIFVGGTNQQIYGHGTKKVKTFDPITQSWQLLPNILDYRWYPTLAQLPNGRLLVIGGGGLSNPVRVNTSEIYDPYNLTTVAVDNIQIGNEVSPIVLLYTGEVLMTHRPPQLFNIQTEQWDAAADFVQGNRMPNGDHSDHELVLLPEGDGRVVAIGHISFTPGVGNMVEFYDPIGDSWSLGSNFSPVRSRAKTVLLPDKKILVAGGYKEETANNSPVNQWGQLYLTDLYNPYQDKWRRLDNLNYAREYHCITALVPDGRVIAAGGEGQPGNEPSFSVIEAFEPPYLFRGVRPEISNLSANQFSRGNQFTFEVQKADSLTSVVLMSTAAVTHFMNSGNNRYLELDFTQTGQQVTVNIPNDSVKVPYGYYMLFGMVDDIPSIAEIIGVGSSIPTEITENSGSEELDFNIYPNPAGKQVSLQLATPIEGMIQIKLMDAMGTLIQTEQVEANRSGIFKTYSLVGLASGTYYISAEMEGTVKTRKIVLVK